MKYEFTAEDIKNEINKVYLEDEDVLLEGDYIEDFEEKVEDAEEHDHNHCDCGCDHDHEHHHHDEDENERLFKIVSKAQIDGERYHDFETVFAVDKDLEFSTAAELMNAEWLWYDWLLD